LKLEEPARLAELAIPYFNEAGMAMTPHADGVAFLASAMSMASASVDRLSQIPARLAFLFDFSPSAVLSDSTVRQELDESPARAVVAAFGEELRIAPRLDKERFRAAANAVKAKTGQKGRALFHPIRLVLTGKPDGPELDLAVPAIDRGAELPVSAGVPSIVGCRERVAGVLQALGW
jgi:glutamyl/glutaminyl-tRNA synthetase